MMTAHDLLMQVGEKLQMAAEDSEDHTTYIRLVRDAIVPLESYYQRYAWEVGIEQMMPQQCELHHQWYAPMFYELGGWFYANEEMAFCPRCGGEPV